jgi:hypothetical protein
MKKYHWSTVSSEPISFEAIRKMYKVEKISGVTHGFYDPETRFYGSGSEETFAVRYHVISGSMKITEVDASRERDEGRNKIILFAGEFTDLEKGEFWYEVIGSERVHDARAVFFGAHAAPPEVFS